MEKYLTQHFPYVYRDYLHRELLREFYVECILYITKRNIHLVEF
jgi:hypothetical protein